MARHGIEHLTPVTVDKRPLAVALAFPPEQETTDTKPLLLLTAGPVLQMLGDGLPHPLLLLPPGSAVPVPLLAEPTIPSPQEQPDTASPTTRFLERLAALQPRIAQLIIHHWYDEFDAYERDNLVQAGIVHLWRAYLREPAKFDSAGDGLWFGVAKQGARHEINREYRRRFRQRGSGARRDRQIVETVFSAGDLLARMAYKFQGKDEPDETLLDCTTVYSHDTAAIQHVDRRLYVAHLEHLIYSGTDPSDHPRIRRILGYMREGCSIADMVRQEDLARSTIQRTITRIREACGAVQSAQANKRRDYGDSKDQHIRELREQGHSGPEIARLTGTGDKFVYTRLRAMKLI